MGMDTSWEDLWLGFVGGRGEQFESKLPGGLRFGSRIASSNTFNSGSLEPSLGLQCIFIT